MVQKNIVILFIISLFFINVFNILYVNALDSTSATSTRDLYTLKINKYMIFYIINGTMHSTYIYDNNYVVKIFGYNSLFDRCNEENITSTVEKWRVVKLSDLYRVNVITSEGMQVNQVILNIEYYLGCDYTKIINITKIPVESDVYEVNIKILVKKPKNYTSPAILFSKLALIVYEKLNSTHIKVYINVPFSYIGATTPKFYGFKTYNLTAVFTIDTRTWTAKYWNEERGTWEDLGVIPLATYFMNTTYILYKIYQNYYDSINYYLANRGELERQVEELRRLRETNYASYAETLIELVRSPLPRGLPGTGNLELSYANIDYVADLEKVWSPTSINVSGPSYSWVIPVIDIRKYTSFKSSIEDALKEYLASGDNESLVRLLESAGPFIEYRAMYKHRGGIIAVFSPVLSSSTLFGFYFINNIFTVPAGVMSGLPQEVADTDWVSIHLSGVQPNGTVDIREGWVVRVPIVEPFSPKQSLLVVAVDWELAWETMLFSKRIVSSGARAAIINDLVNVVVEKYRRAWLDVLAGGNPEEAFGEALEGIREAVLYAAERLAGEDGRFIMESVIEGRGVPPPPPPPPPPQDEGGAPGTATATTGTPAAQQPGTAGRGADDGGAGATGVAGGGGVGTGRVALAAAVAAAVVLVVAAVFLSRRGR